MLRVLLSTMVPLIAIGLTGVIVTSIGRLLLYMAEHYTLGMGPGDAATLTALVLTIAIMVGCSMVASRRPS